VQFVAAGLREGETAVIAIFEEHPDSYLARAKTIGVDLRDAVKNGKLRVIYLRPLDLSVDETLEEIRSAVIELGATRVVIDSISGFEMALAPTFREDFRESLYRLIGALTNLGATIFSTVEVKEGNTGLQLTGYQVSFLTDDIISQRFIELEGELRKVLVIVKMRGSDHSRAFRTYEMTASGVLLREFLRDYDGIIGGAPQRMLRAPRPEYPGLTDREALVIETMVRDGIEHTVPQLGLLTGLDAFTLETILERLVQQNFATRKGKSYEAVPRSRST
jgi:circadian clock protein KaiC